MTECGGQTHFDFLITFSDGFRVILELDGAQHFWNTLKYFSDDGCERDLLKETWALQQGLCVIRVLQEDVWNDRLDWQGWILRSIEAARECRAARVFTPDAPEYRSNESAYVKLHESGIVPT
jgi:very-short-patch-repair endonuclease